MRSRDRRVLCPKAQTRVSCACVWRRAGFTRVSCACVWRRAGFTAQAVATSMTVLLVVGFSEARWEQQSVSPYFHRQRRRRTCLASSGLFVSCSLWSCPDGHVSSCPSFLVLPPLRLFLSCPVILLALVLSPHVLPPLVSSGLVHSGLVPAVSGSLLGASWGGFRASAVRKAL